MIPEFSDHAAYSAEQLEDEAFIDRMLFTFFRDGSLPGIQFALSLGANPAVSDAEGMTILHHVAAAGARSMFRVLDASGRCDYLAVDSRGRYASDLAAEWGHDYALARLIRRKQRAQAQKLGVPAWQAPSDR